MYLERVQQEVERYKKARPELGELLNAYAAILRVQEVLKASIVPVLDQNVPATQANLKAGKPILHGQILPIDSSLFRQGLGFIAEILELGGQARLSTSRLLGVSDLQPEKLYRLIEKLVQDKKLLRKIASTADIDESVLAFLLRSVLVPFYEAAATKFRDQIKDLWSKGACPFCGSEPRMTRLDGEGRRFLYCSLCRMEWPFPRLACPFCDGVDGSSLQYLYIEGDRGHRVDICDACRRYIKVCDERVLGRSAFLDVEDIVTLSLDAVAAREGYS